MKEQEHIEIAQIPEKYRPISPWAYWGLSILYAIPVVGLIFLIVHSASSGNVNRRNYARSYFIIYVIIAIIAAVFLALGGTALLSELAYDSIF